MGSWVGNRCPCQFGQFTIVQPEEEYSITSSKQADGRPEVSPGRSRFRVWQGITAVLAISLAAIVVLAVADHGTLWSELGPKVEISSITLTVDYVGNQTGYIGPTSVNECPECPILIQEGSSAQFAILVLNFSSSGPAHVYTTILVNSTYPFYEMGAFVSSPSQLPPLVTSQGLYNVSYLAGSSLRLFPVFQIPSEFESPPSDGDLTIFVEASPNPLPNVSP